LIELCGDAGIQRTEVEAYFKRSDRFRSALLSTNGTLAALGSTPPLDAP
jgi:hypothetical protein